MGTKERNARDREAIRRRILDAARELFVAEGYSHVSIRRIAQRIEYSPGAIYSYFRNKDDIFFALAEEGFRKLFEFTGGAPADDPLTAVREGFLQYYRFSRLHPEYFELMFMDRTVPRIGQNWQGFATVAAMIDNACAGIRRAVEAGVLPAGLDPQVAFHVLWTAVHGPTTVALCERIAPDEDAEALVRDTLEAALAGLRAGIRTTFIPSKLHICCEQPSENGDDHAAHS
jgi:AcrR family transcriptional regulator